MKSIICCSPGSRSLYYSRASMTTFGWSDTICFIFAGFSCLSAISIVCAYNPRTHTHPIQGPQRSFPDGIYSYMYHLLRRTDYICNRIEETFQWRLKDLLNSARDIGEEAFDDGFATTQVGERDPLVRKMSLVLIPESSALKQEHHSKSLPCSVQAADAARGTRTPSPNKGLRG